MASNGGIMAASIIKFSDQHDLFAWAAKDFIAKAREALEHKKYFDVALSGGSTAQVFFATLAHAAHSQVFLNRIRFFVSDERVIELSSVESNAGNAWRTLLAPLNISISNFCPLYDASCSPEEAAVNYEKQLKELLPLNKIGIPVFDLVYLGIGQDGHTASLFPNSPLVNNIDADQRLIAATKEEIAGFRRLSFMPKLINAAKNICIMATGSSKAAIIDNIMNGPVFPKKLPAQLILRTKRGGLVVLISAH